jgi:hypothetical protein
MNTSGSGGSCKAVLLKETAAFATRAIHSSLDVKYAFRRHQLPRVLSETGRRFSVSPTVTIFRIKKLLEFITMRMRLIDFGLFQVADD